MNLALIATLALHQQADFAWFEMDGLLTPPTKTAIRVPLGALEVTKHSPIHDWTFPRTVTGMLESGGQFTPRFRVFRQNILGKPEDDVSVGVTRFLLRLVEMNRTRLRLDHSVEFPSRTVDVYLCDGGEPGALQRLSVDKDDKLPGGGAAKVNTIHIYAIGGLNSRLEWARELAHEYGHATLPPVTIPGGPEEWANGDLGERMYLSRLHELLVAGKASPSDTMGASAEQLQRYVAQNVTPLVMAAATLGPRPKVLESGDKATFDAYLGLALYCEKILPRSIFARSLVLPDDQSPGAYARAIVAATSEVAEWKPSLPEELKGSPVWLPLGKGKLQGGNVLSRAGDWAKVSLNPGATVAN
ncbi:MAG: hypothetical protein AB7F50_02365 [Fimbriimonadaceae bacterium]